MSSFVHEDSNSSNSIDSDEGRKWRGCTMDEIHRHLNEFELEHVPPVRPTDRHTVLYRFPIRAADSEPPETLRGHHKWDAHHVRLPCSSKSQYPVTAEDGNTTIECRWEMIEKALLRPIANSRELEEAVLAYNSRYQDQWRFCALHKLFDEELDESEAHVFFEDLLPRIIRLALRMPELVQSAIPLLKQGQTHSVTLTQEQIACLLANAFLCTFPRRNTMKRKSEYSSFPDINFNRLFQSTGHHVLEKIKCICHYFRRVCPTEQSSGNVPTGVVTFTRRSLHYSEMPNWSECLVPFTSTLLHITSEGTIEDQGMGLLQVDFANKFLGGGVLGSGCVQEEIRFVICPELLVSKLFTESLRPTEALLMVGCERYSNYTGYARSFQWAGDHEDATPRDSSRRRQTHIVAIDALSFAQSSHQYREELMLRELNKAYVGFYHPLKTPAPGVASGNWGCGAFGGEATLKALIQIMACAATTRPLVYYTFGNKELRDAVHDLFAFLSRQQLRVCDLWATLKRFQAQQLEPKELYNFIYSCHAKKSPNMIASQNRTDVHSRQSPITLISEHSVKKHQVGSSVLTEPHPSVDGSTPASTSKGASERHESIIEDLFASVSSSSSDDNAVDRTKPNRPSTHSKASTLIPDDNNIDGNALLTKTTETTAKDEHGTESSSSKAAVKQRSEPKRRTLLEMLDFYYSEGSQAKRPKS